MPLVEILSGQAAAFRRSQKFLLGKQRHSAAHRNSVWTSSGIPPLTEIMSGRAAALRRSRKFFLDKERQSAARRNSSWTSNKFSFEARFCLGEAKKSPSVARFLRKSHPDARVHSETYPVIYGNVSSSKRIRFRYHNGNVPTARRKRFRHSVETFQNLGQDKRWHFLIFLTYVFYIKCDKSARPESALKSNVMIWPRFTGRPCAHADSRTAKTRYPRIPGDCNQGCGSEALVTV